MKTYLRDDAKKNSKSGIKKFLKLKEVLAAIAVICSIAILLTVTLFSRYIFDCINVEKSVHMSIKNSLSGKVYLTDEGQVRHDTENDYFDYKKYDAYYFNDADEVSFAFNSIATFNKDIDVHYEIFVKPRLTIKSGSTGAVNGSVVRIIDYDAITPTTGTLQCKADTPKNIVSDEKHLFIETYYNDFLDFKDGHHGLTCELNLNFTIRYKNLADNTVIADTTMGVSMALEDSIIDSISPYKITTSGVADLENDFPPRQLNMPGIPAIIGITLLLGILITGLILAVRELLKDSDNYKRAINKILSRFKDEVVTANFAELPPDRIRNSVINFKELLKFSQHLSKPIIFVEKEDFGLFYILCDDMIYQYELKKNAESADAKKNDLKVQDEK